MCGTYAPDNPTAEGYEFTGWTPKAIPEDSTGDITFTASWERKDKTYRISYKNFPDTVSSVDYDGDGYKKAYTPIDSDYIPPIPQR